MLKKLSIFIIISINLYSNQLEILKEQYKQIKNSMIKLEELKEKNWSELNYLKLKKELISKNLEIIKEENRELKEKYQIESELKKIDKVLEILNSKIKEYKTKKEIMEKNRDVVSDMEIMNVKYNIFNLEEQLKLNIRAKNYSLERLKEFSKLKVDKTENIKKEIEKTYKILEDIAIKELKIANLENLGEKELEIKECNLKIVKLQKEEELKNIKKEKERLNKELEDNKTNLKIIDERLKILNLEKEVLLKKSKVGLVSKTELFEKDMEYMNKLIEKLDNESKIEYLKMELSE